MIDFSRSYLTFITKKERSHGRFSLEAICESDKRSERYYLGAMVMAGNVYADNELLKMPPYTFQVIASAERHEILRDYGAAQPAGDSSSENDSVFSDMIFDLCETPARVLASVPDIVAAAHDRAPLNVSIGSVLFDGREVALHFPVKHINTQSNPLCFQVETGPVLIPRGLGNVHFSPSASRFDLAYAFINRLDECELALWRPMPGKVPVFRFFCERRILRANILLFAPSVA